MFGGEMLTRKEGIERQEDLPYEEQDLKGTLFKIIKERTGIGISALFEEEGYTWETVVKAFKSKGLGEEDALMNARLAKILTCEDYDPINRRVIPWTPASSP